MNSSLYIGTVIHRRLKPIGHLLRYKIFYLLIDLDELNKIDRKIRFLSVGKRNVISFMPTDFADGKPGNLKQKISDKVKLNGVTAEIKSIYLLCIPRIFGYAFNPLSTYYCFDADNKLVAMVYEVSNTFGERHTYVSAVKGVIEGERIRHSCEKKLYVSPFISMNCTYHFSVLAPGKKLALGIKQTEEGEPLLNASFVGQQEKLTTLTLGLSLVKFPFNSLKVIAGIHWEALRLWIKGIKLVDRPATAQSVAPLNQPPVTTGYQEK